MRRATTFIDEQFRYMKIAKELCYREEVIEKLKEAATITELSNIMTRARLKMMEK